MGECLATKLEDTDIAVGALENFVLQIVDRLDPLGIYTDHLARLITLLGG